MGSENKRSLLEDLSIHELYRMRDSGMSNNDIANALGVSRSTIYRYIGKKGHEGDAMKENRKSQTEKFMARMDKRAMQAGSQPETTREAIQTATLPATPPASENPSHEAPEPAAQHLEGTTHKADESGLPTPVRVLKEYDIGAGIFITWDTGRITIRGAENMDCDTTRRLCRAIMILDSKNRMEV